MLQSGRAVLRLESRSAARELHSKDERLWNDPLHENQQRTLALNLQQSVSISAPWPDGGYYGGTRLLQKTWAADLSSTRDPPPSPWPATYPARGPQTPILGPANPSTLDLRVKRIRWGGIQQTTDLRVRKNSLDSRIKLYHQE
ncbi:hypothetical protein WN51_10790 [Melipona quadrifasciata]|uniref:Uncharacterized protein n=1 Tax=Melipona quadrifasciata TaxID=166423 RepID=A0A0N0BHY9_9HYME|nr:hypothetical protein WN51_10790 [Melipona quadrifasciata]